MRRPRSAQRRTATTILALLVLAAGLAGCGGSPAASTASTSPPGSAAASVSPSDVPAGTAAAAEATLLAGMRKDLAGACAPLRADLPPKALGALACRSTDPIEAGLRVYLFNDQADLMAAYLAIVAQQGIVVRTNLTSLSIAEGAYTPGDDPTAPMIAERHAWWRDDTGNARYLAMEPPFVLLAATGTNGDVNALVRWAWRGVQDVPGAPNIWVKDHPADPSGKG